MPGRKRYCRNGGHIIPEGQERCPQCRRQRGRERRAARAFPQHDRPCPSGRHIIPAGIGRCRPCKTEADRRAREVNPERSGTAAARLRGLQLPLEDILDGAACTPEDAHLFDVGAPKHLKAYEDRRHAQAKTICAACPVVAGCWADAYEHRSIGVYGGMVFDAGYWSGEAKRQAKALVQVVQDVQDSSAC